MPISQLTLDGSFPIDDVFHSVNQAGVIRFIDAEDSFTLPAFQRLQGDLVNRFSLHERKINELVQAVNQVPILSGWDDSAYVKANGSRGFIGPVSGRSPTADNHLATKGYVDEQKSAISESLQNLTQVLGTLQGVRSVSSIWQYVVWSASEKILITLPLEGTISDEEAIIGMNLMEAIDVADSGDEKFVYRPVGELNGAVVDDYWLDGNSVKVLLPNRASFPTGYPAEYQRLMSPRGKKYKATVFLKT